MAKAFVSTVKCAYAEALTRQKELSPVEDRGKAAKGDLGVHGLITPAQLRAGIMVRGAVPVLRPDLQRRIQSRGTRIV